MSSLTPATGNDLILYASASDVAPVTHFTFYRLHIVVNTIPFRCYLPLAWQRHCVQTVWNR